MNEHDDMHLALDEKGSVGTDILLVSMPFGPLISPSIGLGLLQASLRETSYSVQSLYFTLDFAKRIDPLLYVRISDGHPKTYVLLGEWLFSLVLNNTSDQDIEEYIENVLAPELEEWRGNGDDGPYGTPEAFLEAVAGVRQELRPFLDECLQRILEHQPKVVGFTSVFQQHLASLCLARLIREHAPEVKIVFGGANCEGSMGAEMLRQFPFVDVVVSGEGDLIVQQLMEHLIESDSPPDIQGVHTRQSLQLTVDSGGRVNTPVVRSMDDLPCPHYDDYFEQLQSLFATEDFPSAPVIPFETSRGCWWGEVKHCTFCGLNGDTMQFRSKSSARAISELRSLVASHPDLAISVVDNILDMGYFKTFIPELAESDLNVELFYETKANLRKEQIYALREAGIIVIQPGVESLSTEVLRLMRKGVSAMQNVQLLKWCKEIGVKPYWNVLWGFPREPAEEYTRLAGEVWKFGHLTPPTAYATIRLDRFSPNFNTPRELGFVNVKPYPCYSYIYQCSDEARANLAYFFTFEYDDARDINQYVEGFRKEIDRWRVEYDKSDLFYIDKGESLLVWDFRRGAKHSLYVLTHDYRKLYLMCDGIMTATEIKQLLPSEIPERDWAEVRNMLTEFIDTGLVMKEDDKYLSLALPTESYTPAPAVLEKLVSFSKQNSAQNPEKAEGSLKENQQQSYVFS